MSWQQFTIDLISSLADLLRAVLWPLVVLAVAWRFKTEIAENLGDLLKRLESLKAGPVEGRWGVRARHAGDAIARSQSDEEDDIEASNPEPGLAEDFKGPQVVPRPDDAISATEDAEEEIAESREIKELDSSLDSEQQDVGEPESSQIEISREMALTKTLPDELSLFNSYTAFIATYKTQKLRELIEIEGIITISPRAAVLAAYATLEDVIRTVLISTRKVGALALVRENRDLVPESIQVSVAELTQLKNEVGHEARDKLAPVMREDTYPLSGRS